MKKWLQAAKRYKAAQKPGFKPRKKRDRPQQPPPSLKAFLASGDGKAAQKLLAASKQEIRLGVSEEVMSSTTAVIFDGEGLKTHSGVVGMAAAYSTKKPKQEPIDAAAALNLLQRFPEENLLGEKFDEESLVEHVRRELDRIATEAP